jgi:hypothetical protein
MAVRVRGKSIISPCIGFLQAFEWGKSYHFRAAFASPGDSVDAGQRGRRRLTGEGGLQQDAAELLERSLQTGEPAPTGG